MVPLQRQANDQIGPIISDLYFMFWVAYRQFDRST